MDPDLATSTTKQIQRELAAAGATIAGRERAEKPTQLLTAEDFHRALDAVAVVVVVAVAPTSERLAPVRRGSSPGLPSIRPSPPPVTGPSAK